MLVKLSIFKVDNLTYSFPLWKFFGSLIFSLAVDRWSWGDLFGKSVSPHPFQKLFLRVLRTLRLRFIISLLDVYTLLGQLRSRAGEVYAGPRNPHKI